MMTRPPSDRSALLAARLLASSGNNSAAVPQLLLRGNGKTSAPMIRAQDAIDPNIGPSVRPIDPNSPPSGRVIDDAGLFGASATLPGMDPGSPEPGLLNMPPLEGPTPNTSGDPSAPYSPGTSAMFAPISGEHWLGGRIVGTDPNNGKPIYDPNGYGPMSGLGVVGANVGPVAGYNFGIGGSGFGGVGNNSAGVTLGAKIHAKRRSLS